MAIYGFLLIKKKTASSRVLLTQGLCHSASTSSCGSSLIQRKNPNIFNIKEKKKYGIMVLIEKPPVFVI